MSAKGIIPKYKPFKLCSIPGCGLPHFGRGLCQRHLYVEKRKNKEQSK
jgi:hypothetical protein